MHLRMWSQSSEVGFSSSERRIAGNSLPPVAGLDKRVFQTQSADRKHMSDYWFLVRGTRLVPFGIQRRRTAGHVCKGFALLQEDSPAAVGAAAASFLTKVLAGQ
jgi:hypothetical protein